MCRVNRPVLAQAPACHDSYWGRIDPLVPSHLGLNSVIYVVIYEVIYEIIYEVI